MDNEQLQNWLCKLHERFCPDRAQRQQQQDELETNGCDGASTSMDSSAGPTAKKGEEKADEMEQQQPSLQKWRHQLQQLAPQTNMLLNYFVCNFNDPRLSEPLVAQLLALYYRLGIARCFVLQLVPTFIHSYLKALTKRWSASAKMLEMFFLAIYNEEILAAGPCTPSMAKRADEVRLPSLRRGRPPSASKLGADQLFGNTSNPPIMGLNSSGPHKTQKSQAETIGINITRPAATAALVTATAGGGSLPRMFGSAASGVVTVTNTGTTTVGVGGGSSSGLGSQKAPRNSVRIGPFPAIEKIIAENRFLILTRLLRTVNQMLPKMAPEVVCRAMCLSLLYICRSGFSFQESDFRQRVLREWASNEVFADFSRKSRIRSIPSHFLVESINGLTYALLNGHEDAALRALDAIHQRAQYELMADVLLETNALRHALSDPKTVQTILSDGDSTTMNGNGTKVEEEATKTPPAATAVGNDEELRKWQPNSTNSQKINSLAPTS